MKKETKLVMLLVLAVVMSANLSAQISKNIVDTTKQWNVLCQYGGVTTTIFYRILERDTIIDDKKYNIVQECRKYYTAEDTCHCRDASFIREDSGRVYAYAKELMCYITNYPGGEYLLYDYNLFVGDSILLYRDSSPYPYAYPYIAGGEYVVQKIDSILVDDTYLKRIFLKCTDATEGVECWVEGVGSLNGLLHSACRYFDISMHLFCAMQDDLILYKENPNYSECYIFSQLETINDENISIFPTIVSDKFEVHASTDDYHIKIFTIYGTLVGNYTIDGISRVINTESWSKGIYFVVLQDDQRVVKKQKLIKL